MAERRESVRVTASGEDFAREFARLRRDAEQLQAAIRAIPNRVNIRADADGFTRVAAQSAAAEKSIDKLSGRIGLFARALAVVGPAAIPIAGVAVPALTGLASSLGFAALAGGVAIGSFQGVGDALEAMNKAHLEPTAENLEKAEQAMNAVSPAARDLVKQLRSMGPALKDIRDAGAEGMFPGLVDGLDAMESRLPDIERIFSAVGGELGSIASDVGDSFASERWDDFFTFLETDAPSALADMAEGTGNLTHALAEMWMAFDPVNDDFSSWLVGVTADFDRWASQLSGSTGFQEFIDYLRSTGPQVGDTLGAIGNALVQIVQAAAPIAGPVLRGLEAFANIVASIADSDLGTPIFGMVAAMSALNLAMRASSAISRTTFGGPMVASIGRQRTALQGLRADWAAYSAVTRTAQGRAQASATAMIAHTNAAARLGTSLRATGTAALKGGAAVGALAILSTEAGQGLGVTNTAALGLAGSMAGPWGAAIGVAVGAMLDLSHANDDAAAAITRMNAAIDAGNVSQLTASLRQVNAELADAKNLGGLGDIFETIGKDMGATFSGDFDRIGNLQAAAAQARGALSGIGSFEAGAGIANQFGLVERTARAAAEANREFARSMAIANNAISRQATWDSYRSSVLDARDAVREYGSALSSSGNIVRGHARAGLALRSSLFAMATSANKTADGMKNMNKRSAFIRGARADFIRLAGSMGVGAAAAARMAQRFFGTASGADAGSKAVQGLNTRIRALRSKIVDAKERGASESSQRVQNLRAQIAALRDKAVTIRTTEIHTRIQQTMIKRGFLGAGGAVAPNQADGGTVLGAARYPYGDKVFTHLAPGEEVISNRYGQADKHRALLKAINANRYANGGTVASRAQVAAPNVNVDGANVTALVYIDGKQIDARVDVRMGAHQDIADQRRRAVTSG